MKSLTELALELTCDKGPGIHDYTPFYERLFEPLRDQPLSLLEVGVHEGKSMQLWLRYFQNASITGVDHRIHKYAFKPDKRLRLIKGSILDESTWDAIGTPYDIVIEDSAHEFATSMAVFARFEKVVKPGGLMIFEDMQVAWESPTSHPCQSLKSFISAVDERIHRAKKDDAIESAILYPGIIALRRKP